MSDQHLWKELLNWTQRNVNDNLTPEERRAQETQQNLEKSKEFYEKKAFLEQVMKELNVDLVSQMKDLLQCFQNPSSITTNKIDENVKDNEQEESLPSSTSKSIPSESFSSSSDKINQKICLERQLQALEELEELTETIDMAQVFAKIGGVDILLPYIEQYLSSIEGIKDPKDIEIMTNTSSLDLVLGILPIFSMVSQNNPDVQNLLFPSNGEEPEHPESKIIRSLCSLILISANQIKEMMTRKKENDQISSNSDNCSDKDIILKLEKLQFKALGALSCLIRGHQTAEKIFFNMRQTRNNKVESIQKIDAIQDKLSIIIFSTMFTQYYSKTDHVIGGKVNETGDETCPPPLENSMRSRILTKSFFFLQALIASDYIEFDVSIPLVQNLLSLILFFLDSKDVLIRGSCQNLITRYNALIYTMVTSNPQIKVTPLVAGGYSDQLKENLLIKCQVMKRILMKTKNSINAEENTVEEIGFWEDFEKFLHSSSSFAPSTNVNTSSTSKTTTGNTVDSDISSNNKNNDLGNNTGTSTDESPVLMLAPPTMTGATNEP